MQMLFIRKYGADLLALTAAVTILVGSFMPQPALPAGEGSDKVIHFLAYGALAFFALFGRQTLLGAGLVILVVIGFGLGIEYLQPFAGRDWDPGDIVANTTGVLLGALAVLVFRYLKRLMAG